MKTLNLFFALVIILITGIQCTEDETIEASANQIEKLSIESGEEGDQELDTDRD